MGTPHLQFANKLPVQTPRIVAKALRSPQFWFGATVLVPTFLFYWIFHFKLIIDAFRISFVRYKITDPAASRFVGLDNYRSIIDNSLFWDSVRATISWSVMSFVLVLPIATLLAICLARLARGRNVYQAIIFVPFVVSLVGIGLMFRMILDPQTGQLNALLRSLGLPPGKWLTDTSTALWTLVGIASWKRLGLYVVLLTAAILQIPQDMQDAAMVDGTNEWQRFRHITFPLIGRTQVLVGILLAVATLQVFTEPYILTGGGPGHSTYVYNMLIYDEAFTVFRFGTAAAAAVFQFFLILAISVFQMRIFEPKWSY